MVKVVIGNDGQGTIIVIKASSIANAKKRLKRFKHSHFQGSDVSNNFDYEVTTLI